jgi:hypothetical protein
VTCAASGMIEANEHKFPKDAGEAPKLAVRVVEGDASLST